MAEQDVGLFLGTTDVYDLQRLAEVDPLSEDFKLLMVRLYQNLNNIVIALNLKDTGYYVKTPFVNGQQFFRTSSSPQAERMVYRLVIEVGALPPGVTTVAHNIGIPNINTYTFTRIYGTANDNTGNNFYPIPFVGDAGAFISLVVNLTKVVLDNESGISFNECIVVVEYITY